MEPRTAQCPGVCPPGPFALWGRHQQAGRSPQGCAPASLAHLPPSSFAAHRPGGLPCQRQWTVSNSQSWAREKPHKCLHAALQLLTTLHWLWYTLTRTTQLIRSGGESHPQQSSKSLLKTLNKTSYRRQNRESLHIFWSHTNHGEAPQDGALLSNKKGQRADPSLSCYRKEPDARSHTKCEAATQCPQQAGRG